MEPMGFFFYSNKGKFNGKQVVPMVCAICEHYLVFILTGLRYNERD